MVLIGLLIGVDVEKALIRLRLPGERVNRDDPRLDLRLAVDALLAHLPQALGQPGSGDGQR